MLNWFKISYAQIGFSGTIYYLADIILRKIKIGSIYPYCFLSQPLSAPAKKLRLSKNYAVRKVQPDDPRLLEMLPSSICDYRFEQRAICIGAFKEETLTALLWFTTDVYHEDEVRANFIPPLDACWDFGVHIEPEYRMTRAFSNLWGASTVIMSGMGYRNSLSRISAFNPVSLHAHIRMGAKLIAKAIFINIGPMQISFSNTRPLLYISFFKNSRPTFHFHKNDESITI
ncbi:hypothetical protein MNBD_ALPHA03-138 [hydrothermal vent metagenome]|uniref:Uncharacterized protein n=1 Tax=hydrothermal vent metagenome TaxID=652676 RepID=A0A3B1B319_9ZZZZ